MFSQIIHKSLYRSCKFHVHTVGRLSSTKKKQNAFAINTQHKVTQKSIKPTIFIRTRVENEQKSKEM